MSPAADDDTARPFQVHLRGIVELLSRSIYTTPQTYLRELLQNGVDALGARRELDGGGTGIRVVPVSPGHPSFVLEDDGIGLTADEVADLLATVGRSSKRDVLDLPRTDRLGQFGIGLLSCFMVTDDIVVRSRSAAGGEPVEWVGRADGTFTVRVLRGAEAAAVPVGSRVELVPRSDVVDLLSTPNVVTMAARFGEFLPVRISVDLPDGGSEVVNREPVFVRPFREPSHELMAYGREFLGVDPFDAIELHVPATGTRGTAYVLPFAPSPGARSTSRAYLGGMLVTERLDDLLPDWAFFVRAVVDTTGLHPTASREAFVDDDALEQTRVELGAVLRRWVLRMASTDQGRLQAFLSVHDLALRALALHDDELAAFVLPHLLVETSNGLTTYGELARTYPRVRFTGSSEEFQQVAGIARGDAPIVDGGIVYAADLVRRLPDLYPDVTVEEVSVHDELEALQEPPLAERGRAQRLAARAESALDGLGCDVVVRSFSPHDVAALHVADPDLMRQLERGKAKDVSGGLWADILGRLDEGDLEDLSVRHGFATGQLCLNWENRLVRTLADTDDEVVLARTIRLLYVQALLAAHRPLRPVDRAVLTDAMTDIVDLSLGLGPQAGATS